MGHTLEVLEPGRLVAERYRVIRLIGEGGMGSVWAAEQTVTGRTVALKVLKGTDEMDPALRARFLREGRAACAVNHPNVVTIHDVLELDGGTPVIVMELLDGESLAELLARTGALPLEQTANYLLPVVSAVGTAHAMGIVHRDLKPENILLARQADGSTTVKVLDFGIAKMSPIDSDAAGASLTSTGAIIGTPYYMSPEQAFADKDIDERADIWSLGIILYECLSGQLPTDGESLGQILKTVMSGAIKPLAEQAPWVPRDVCNLVDRMLQRDRARRPADLREVLEILRRHGSDAVVSFSAAGVPHRRSMHDMGALSWSDMDPTQHAGGPSETGPQSTASGATTEVAEGPNSNVYAATQAATSSGVSTASSRTSDEGATMAGATAPRRAQALALEPRRRRWPWAAAGLAVAVVGTVGGIALTRGGGAGSDRVASSATADPPHVADPPEPSATAAQREPATLDAGSTSSSPSASATAAPSAMPGGKPQAAPPHAWRTATRPKPNPPAASKAPPAATPSASKPPRTPGGVVDKPPF